MGGCCSSEEKKKCEEPLLKNENDNRKNDRKDTDPLSLQERERQPELDERGNGDTDQDLIETRQKRSSSENNLENNANSHLNHLHNNRNSIDELTFSGKLDDLRHIDSEVTVYEEHKLVLRTELFLVPNGNQKTSGFVTVHNSQPPIITDGNVEISASTTSDFPTEFDPRNNDSTNDQTGVNFKEPLENKTESEKNDAYLADQTDQTIFEHLKPEFVPQLQLDQGQMVSNDCKLERKPSLTDLQELIGEFLITRPSVAEELDSSSAPLCVVKNYNTEKSSSDVDESKSCFKSENDRSNLHDVPNHRPKLEELVSENINLDSGDKMWASNKESNTEAVKTFFDVTFTDILTTLGDEFIISNPELENSLRTEQSKDDATANPKCEQANGNSEKTISNVGSNSLEAGTYVLQNEPLLVTELQGEIEANIIVNDVEDVQYSLSEDVLHTEQLQTEVVEAAVDEFSAAVNDLLVTKEQPDYQEALPNQFTNTDTTSDALDNGNSVTSGAEENQNKEDKREVKDFTADGGKHSVLGDSYTEAQTLYYSPPEEMPENYSDALDNSNSVTSRAEENQNKEHKREECKDFTADEGKHSVLGDSYTEAQTLYFSPPEEIPENYSADILVQETVIQTEKDDADRQSPPLEDDSYSEAQTLFFSLSTEKSDYDAADNINYHNSEENSSSVKSNSHHISETTYREGDTSTFERKPSVENLQNKVQVNKTDTNCFDAVDVDAEGHSVSDNTTVSVNDKEEPQDTTNKQQVQNQ